MSGTSDLAELDSAHTSRRRSMDSRRCGSAKSADIHYIKKSCWNSYDLL